jgi:hypothetical protein
METGHFEILLTALPHGHLPTIALGPTGAPGNQDQQWELTNLGHGGVVDKVTNACALHDQATLGTA